MVPPLLLAPLLVEEGPSVPVVPERAPVLSAAYGSKGAVEASAWLGVSASSVAIEGQGGGIVGWFFANGFELSAIAGLSYVQPGGAELAASLLVEPSVHVAFGPNVMGFTGIGGGPLLSSQGFGFALSQRAGVNVLFGNGGRAGVLTPVLAMTYTTNAPSITAVGAEVAYGWVW